MWGGDAWSDSEPSSAAEDVESGGDNETGGSGSGSGGSGGGEEDGANLTTSSPTAAGIVATNPAAASTEASVTTLDATSTAGAQAQALVRTSTAGTKQRSTQSKKKRSRATAAASRGKSRNESRRGSTTRGTVGLGLDGLSSRSHTQCWSFETLFRVALFAFVYLYCQHMLILCMLCQIWHIRCVHISYKTKPRPAEYIPLHLLHSVLYCTIVRAVWKVTVNGSVLSLMMTARKHRMMKREHPCMRTRTFHCTCGTQTVAMTRPRRSESAKKERGSWQVGAHAAEFHLCWTYLHLHVHVCKCTRLYGTQYSYSLHTPDCCVSDEESGW